MKDAVATPPTPIPAPVSGPTIVEHEGNVFVQTGETPRRRLAQLLPWEFLQASLPERTRDLISFFEKFKWAVRELGLYTAELGLLKAIPNLVVRKTYLAVIRKFFSSCMPEGGSSTVPKEFHSFVLQWCLNVVAFKQKSLEKILESLGFDSKKKSIDLHFNYIFDALGIELTGIHGGLHRVLKDSRSSSDMTEFSNAVKNFIDRYVDLNSRIWGRMEPELQSHLFLDLVRPLIRSATPKQLAAVLKMKFLVHGSDNPPVSIEKLLEESLDFKKLNTKVAIRLIASSEKLRHRYFKALLREKKQLLYAYYIFTARTKLSSEADLDLSASYYKDLLCFIKMFFEDMLEKDPRLEVKDLLAAYKETLRMKLTPLTKGVKSAFPEGNIVINRKGGGTSEVITLKELVEFSHTCDDLGAGDARHFADSKSDDIGPALKSSSEDSSVHLLEVGLPKHSSDLPELWTFRKLLEAITNSIGKISDPRKQLEAKCQAIIKLHPLFEQIKVLYEGKSGYEGFSMKVDRLLGDVIHIFNSDDSCWPSDSSLSFKEAKAWFRTHQVTAENLEQLYNLEWSLNPTSDKNLLFLPTKDDILRMAGEDFQVAQIVFNKIIKTEGSAEQKLAYIRHLAQSAAKHLHGKDLEHKEIIDKLSGLLGLNSFSYIKSLIGDIDSDKLSNLLSWLNAKIFDGEDFGFSGKCFKDLINWKGYTRDLLKSYASEEQRNDYCKLVVAVGGSELLKQTLQSLHYRLYKSYCNEEKREYSRLILNFLRNFFNKELKVNPKATASDLLEAYKEQIGFDLSEVKVNLNLVSKTPLEVKDLRTLLTDFSRFKPSSSKGKEEEVSESVKVDQFLRTISVTAAYLRHPSTKTSSPEPVDFYGQMRFVREDGEIVVISLDMLCGKDYEDVAVHSDDADIGGLF